ncbi:MAG: alpha/beta hydrolase [Gammaproteobacteria bacterium]|nr:alpha/beta hydrolase [Gammaproteobacteria bacterium]
MSKLSARPPETATVYDVDPGRSEFRRIRGLRYHLRRHAAPATPADAPLLFLLHGWLDVSAGWAPVIARLLPRLQVIAPDWRGLGYTQWAPGGYWFHDYLADFDAIADACAPGRRFLLAGHSMGAQVAGLYAGLRPQRIEKLILLDGLMLPDMPPQRAPERVGNWLQQLRRPFAARIYPSFSELARRIAAHHPRLSPAGADFVARCWGHREIDGRVRLLADPRHYLHGPLLYRSAEAEQIWRQVTAPTLMVRAGESEYRGSIAEIELQRRYTCFRDHRVAELPGVGHMLHYEAPQATAAALAEFLFASACV